MTKIDKMKQFYQIFDNQIRSPEKSIFSNAKQISIREEKQK